MKVKLGGGDGVAHHQALDEPEVVKSKLLGSDICVSITAQNGDKVMQEPRQDSNLEARVDEEAIRELLIGFLHMACSAYFLTHSRTICRRAVLPTGEEKQMKKVGWAVCS